jgi:phosphatidylserine decarboxylase
MGKLASSNNMLIKNILIKGFIAIYNPDLADVKYQDLKKFSTYNEFFVRELSSGARPICREENCITSPVDGTIVDFGEIENGSLIQAKTIDYSLSELLGCQDLAEKFFEGFFVTIYLAPTDYHRIHCPFEGEIISTDHFGLDLFSVNASAQTSIPSLYIKNERSVMVIGSEKIQYGLVSVGASIVGSIVPFWLENDDGKRSSLIKAWKNGPKEDVKNLKKGQEIAHFRMGSTVILLMPSANKLNINSLYENKTVKFGEKLVELT